MNRIAARLGLAATLAVGATASAEITVDLGTVQQISPRPNIVYTGGFASAVTSFVDGGGVRTITSFDIHAIGQQFGPNLALVGVRVRDTGSNTYGTWSPGADIDLFRVVGADLSGGTVTVGYSGSVTQHTGEEQGILKSRIADCDAVSGDQHFNSQHFISLGLNGSAWMNFDGFAHNWGGLAGGDIGGWDGSGGSDGGQGQTGGGGGGGGGGTTYGGIIVTQGLRLEIGEAGLGESYGVELVFEQVAVPAPGAIGLLACSGLFGRRRRAR
ncbi:MAG: hypothetical protein ACO31E_09390 [Phycisphaerales bacterium]